MRMDVGEAEAQIFCFKSRRQPAQRPPELVIVLKNVKLVALLVIERKIR